MNEPKLIVMAAGLGSRYGGLKQMEPITAENEIILDFAVYDAMKAGFQDIIFVIKPEMEEIFRQRVMEPMSKYVNVQCVFQKITQLPEGYMVPDGRTKPWGTCHAVMACRDLVQGSFAVINADDYYGKDAFGKVYDFLCSDDSENVYCMAGYYIENTLSEQGTVTRGVCKTDDHGNLTEIAETKGIGWSEKNFGGEEIEYLDQTTGEKRKIAVGTAVSMNFWGFKQSMMQEMLDYFPTFLEEAAKVDSMNNEYLLPTEVGRLLSEDKIKVKVLEASDKWYGVTYKEDKEKVVEAFARMKSEGKYPQKLWK